MRNFVPSQPQQGAMYHKIQALIAQSYSGLGPNNVGQNPYRGMTGMAFQKPTSTVTAQAPVANQGGIHR